MSNNVTTWQIMPEVLQFVRKSYARNAAPPYHCMQSAPCVDVIQLRICAAVRALGCPVLTAPAVGRTDASAT